MKRNVAFLLFDDFELLDVCGPAEILGRFLNDLDIRIVSKNRGPIRSTQGVSLIAEETFRSFKPLPGDICLIPGGVGTRELTQDQAFVEELRVWVQQFDTVTAVCTGSVLLAATGLLDGHRATSNKKAFGWAKTFGKNVEWVPRARWVQDGNFWTSSGVAAGMDMANALAENLFGRRKAKSVVDEIEYEAQYDSTNDPFATLFGVAE